MAKRVFLIVLDSFGVGAEPDAPLFGDVGTNTLGAIAGHPNFRGDNLARLGMFNLDGVTCGTPAAAPIGSYARLREASAGKDTTIGHWEIAGLLSAEPLPTFPDGFPQELLDAFTSPSNAVTEVLCREEANPDKDRKWIRITSHFVEDDAGKPISVIGKIANIDDEMREKMDLSERAHHDGLTGLLNWQTFQETAGELLSNGTAGAVLVVTPILLLFVFLQRYFIQGIAGTGIK